MGVEMTLGLGWLLLPARRTKPHMAAASSSPACLNEKLASNTSLLHDLSHRDY